MSNYLYYVGNKVAYLFSTNDKVHLKIDAVVEKNLLKDGIELMKQAYGDNDIVYQEIQDKLDVRDDLFTLTDFQNIMATPNEKNYSKYNKLITLELYNFLKNLGREHF